MNLSPEFKFLRDDAIKNASLLKLDNKSIRKGVKDRYYKKKMEKKKRNIAVLDMETDPFDNISQAEIHPFVAVLHSDVSLTNDDGTPYFPIKIWEEDHATFISRVISAISNLPDSYTIYAHNGGKFDFMFLVSKLRGEISFKGRGIMRATIGRHELRDSFHIIPDRLANLQKDHFEYAWLARDKRNHHRQEIIDYCISDCKYLLYFINRFIEDNGFKISIGAASLAKIRENYKFERVSEKMDERLRPFYIGGRVECIQGALHSKTPMRLYDVNSMYPYVMAKFSHPIGGEYVFRTGNPNAATCFVKVECDNFGSALLGKDEKGSLSALRDGVFYTSKFEYDTAVELGLISNVKILECVDNFDRTTFEKFVVPLYDQRFEEKAHLDTLTPNSAEYLRTKSNIMFLKYLLNSGYGKFAQNPRRYKEHYITDTGERPKDDFGNLPEYEGLDYWLWSRPSPKQVYNNVGTAASITGAARAVLMRAIHNAINPVYCDTDSLICEELRNTPIDHLALGAWDIETEISELIIVGKKLYGYKDKSGKVTIRSKGASGLTWNDMLGLLADEPKQTIGFGPTLTRQGRQFYMERRVRRTAPLLVNARMGS